ncbi:hypothetical protein [Streptomyces sp. NBC_00102]|uniref:hypothetical protein n=1 Tax=Streptomyces sp. NBC_00102 TaxID=2975652 RepID=UPI00224F6114|nr:hypothetical protein [Streptomyces sp. NBC_00102]MCX5398961.1 hypothetical protein [Streptomyces sp. NBC_00102]
MSHRECTYCPEPGADICVRIHVTGVGSGTTVYAHAACAEQHGVPALYRLLPEAERAVAR